MLQLFVGRCGRRRPLKSPTDSIGGIKVGKIRAALSSTLKPLWRVVRYEPLPKYSKSISSGYWQCGNARHVAGETCGSCFDHWGDIFVKKRLKGESVAGCSLQNVGSRTYEMATLA